MNPRDFLGIATKLSNGNTSAEYRTAVSRAYYAVYNVGVEVLGSMGIHISEGPQGHAHLQHDLGNCGDLELAKIGIQLGDLHHKRIMADYKVSDIRHDSQKTSQALVRQAEKMISSLDQCTASPRRNNIEKAIKEYRHKIGDKNF